MVRAARNANRVVQVGTHRRVSPHNVSGRDFIRNVFAAAPSGAHVTMNLVNRTRSAATSWGTKPVPHPTPFFSTGPASSDGATAA